MKPHCCERRRPVGRSAGLRLTGHRRRLVQSSWWYRVRAIWNCTVAATGSRLSLFDTDPSSLFPQKARQLIIWLTRSGAIIRAFRADGPCQRPMYDMGRVLFSGIADGESCIYRISGDEVVDTVAGRYPRISLWAKPAESAIPA